jgi:hypothetical protein
MRTIRWSLASLILISLNLSATKPPSARLVNLATRAAVGDAAGTPISGFVVAGAGAKPMLVRAVGPALGGFEVTGMLADPRRVRMADATMIAENDN